MFSLQARLRFIGIGDAPGKFCRFQAKSSSDRNVDICCYQSHHTPQKWVVRSMPCLQSCTLAASNPVHLAKPRRMHWPASTGHVLVLDACPVKIIPMPRSSQCAGLQLSSHGLRGCHGPGQGPESWMRER